MTSSAGGTTGAGGAMSIVADEVCVDWACSSEEHAAKKLSIKNIKKAVIGRCK
jgi:hypothetical protein